MLTVTALNSSELKNKTSNFSLGAGAIITSQPYIGQETKVLPFPMIRYDSELFYVDVTKAGVHLYKNRGWEANLQLSYIATGFNSDDAKELNDLYSRLPTLGAGLGIKYNSKNIAFSFFVEKDALGISDGLHSNVQLGYNIRSGKMFIRPFIGSYLRDKKYTDYYYGVSKEESSKTGLAEYNMNHASAMGYVGALLYYGIDKHWSLYANIYYSHDIDQYVKDSPIVDKDYMVYAVSGFLYKF